MYNPREFKVNDTRRLVSFIRERGLGVMFSVSENHDYMASHIPFLVDENCRYLTGHMAIANNQWKSLHGREVLVVFQGPDHYISPSWYKEDHSVPTWNYLAVHVRGIFALEEDREVMADMLDSMVSKFETDAGNKWSVNWNDRDYSDMLQWIVAFRIDVTSAEGKWKLSQNHSREGVMNVSSALAETGKESGITMADLMRKSVKVDERGRTK